MKADQEANFRTKRYALLNKMRWDTFLSMNLPLKDKTVFEPGAGIGDQTEWLLAQGAKQIYVSDGREDNLQLIYERFWDNPRVRGYMLCDLEKDLDKIPWNVDVDFIFCWGVYYHLHESFPGWHIMRELARMGQTIAFDYLTGNDEVFDYGYDNPSTSISRYAFRPRTETLMRALKDIWGYAYLPKNQLAWVDPVAFETRLIAVASHVPLDNSELLQQHYEVLS